MVIVIDKLKFTYIDEQVPLEDEGEAPGVVAAEHIQPDRIPANVLHCDF